MDIHDKRRDKKMIGIVTSTIRICRAIKGVCPPEYAFFPRVYSIEVNTRKPTAYDGLMSRPTRGVNFSVEHNNIKTDPTELGKFLRANDQQIDPGNVSIEWCKQSYKKAQILESIVILARTLVQGTGARIGKLNKNLPYFLLDEDSLLDLVCFVGKFSCCNF